MKVICETSGLRAGSGGKPQEKLDVYVFRKANLVINMMIAKGSVQNSMSRYDQNGRDPPLPSVGGTDQLQMWSTH